MVKDLESPPRIDFNVDENSVDEHDNTIQPLKQADALESARGNGYERADQFFAESGLDSARNTNVNAPQAYIPAPPQEDTIEMTDQPSNLGHRSSSSGPKRKGTYSVHYREHDANVGSKDYLAMALYKLAMGKKVSFLKMMNLAEQKLAREAAVNKSKATKPLTDPSSGSGGNQSEPRTLSGEGSREGDAREAASAQISTNLAGGHVRVHDGLSEIDIAIRESIQMLMATPYEKL